MTNTGWCQRGLTTLLELCPLLDPDETMTLERIEDRIDWFLSACLKVTFGPPIWLLPRLCPVGFDPSEEDGIAGSWTAVEAGGGGKQPRETPRGELSRFSWFCNGFLTGGIGGSFARMLCKPSGSCLVVSDCWDTISLPNLRPFRAKLSPKSEQVIISSILVDLICLNFQIWIAGNSSSHLKVMWVLTR